MAKEPIDIEKLVRWSIIDQQVDMACKQSDVGMLGYSSSQGAVETVQEYGQMIQDGVVERLIAQNCHMDAFTVYDAILTLPTRAGQLVFNHAKFRTRPDWCEEGAGKRVARVGRFGKPATIDMPNGDKHIIYDWDGTPPHAMKQMRAEYVVWWEALAALAVFLEHNLEDYAPHSPRVSREPWCEHKKKVG